MKKAEILALLQAEAKKAGKRAQMPYTETDYWNGYEDALDFAIALLEGKHG